jgi:hypothetical protein
MLEYYHNTTEKAIFRLTIGGEVAKGWKLLDTDTEPHGHRAIYYHTFVSMSNPHRHGGGGNGWLEKTGLHP